MGGAAPLLVAGAGVGVGVVKERKGLMARLSSSPRRRRTVTVMS